MYDYVYDDIKEEMLVFNWVFHLFPLSSTPLLRSGRNERRATVLVNEQRFGVNRFRLFLWKILNRTYFGKERCIRHHCLDQKKSSYFPKDSEEVDKRKRN